MPSNERGRAGIMVSIKVSNFNLKTFRLDKPLISLGVIDYDEIQNFCFLKKLNPQNAREKNNEITFKD